MEYIEMSAGGFARIQFQLHYQNARDLHEWPDAKKRHRWTRTQEAVASVQPGESMTVDVHDPLFINNARQAVKRCDTEHNRVVGGWVLRTEANGSILTVYKLPLVPLG